MIDTEAARAHIARFEGQTSWVYRDSAAAGNATVGVGFLLQSPAAAARLPFVADSQGRPATPDQIEAVYHAVMALPAGHRADYYQRANGTVFLPLDAISAIFDKRFQQFVTLLEKRFPGFAGWPAPVQLATIDWVWNCGVDTLAATHHLAPALRSQNWAAAAAACHRAGDDGTPAKPTLHGIRNAATRDLFLSAVPK